MLQRISCLGLALALNLFALGGAWGDFVYADFTSIDGLNLVEDAIQSGTVISVTPGTISDKGAVWTIDPQEVVSGFVTIYEFEFLAAAGGSASDGMAFVIQNADPSAIGDHAAAMGYGGFMSSPGNGIPKSLAVEMDDYNNGNWGDPDGNHISVHTLGTAPNSPDETTASLGATSAVPLFGQGTGPHTVKVEYAAGTLTIYLDDLDNPALTVDVDLESILESSTAWVGFTASCGAEWQTQNLLSWSFTNGGAPQFRRGDVNNDTVFDISDAITALAALFTPGAPPPACADAADANDDGLFDVSDAVYVLGSLFTPGFPPPVSPGPLSCGPDPTDDPLGCSMTACP